MSPLSEPQEGPEQTFADGYTHGQPAAHPLPQGSIPAGTVYGNYPHGMGNSATVPPEPLSAAPSAAPERKVVKKVVRRWKGTPRTTSPAPTQTGSAAADVQPEGNPPTGWSSRPRERLDTAEGDGLSESHIQLLEIVLYYCILNGVSGSEGVSSKRGLLYVVYTYFRNEIKNYAIN